MKVTVYRPTQMHLTAWIAECPARVAKFLPCSGAPVGVGIENDFAKCDYGCIVEKQSGALFLKVPRCPHS